MLHRERAAWQDKLCLSVGGLCSSRRQGNNEFFPLSRGQNLGHDVEKSFSHCSTFEKAFFLRPAPPTFPFFYYRLMERFFVGCVPTLFGRRGNEEKLPFCRSLQLWYCSTSETVVGMGVRIQGIGSFGKFTTFTVPIAFPTSRVYTKKKEQISSEQARLQQSDSSFGK